MPSFLLDTNVISELRKTRPHGAVVSWISRLRQDEIFICAVSLGELQRGIERTRRSDLEKAAQLETWVDRVAGAYNAIPMDGIAFREWARIMDRQSDDLLEDAMIAAVARIHQLTVATRNEADFAALRTPYFNPFKI